MSRADSAFKCRQCGACCRVPGPVRLRRGEDEAIAAALKMDVRSFVDRYARLTRDRTGLSLEERPDHACVFLTDEGTCRIETTKPQQCRDFPHRWHYAGYERDCAAMTGVPA